MFGLKERGAFGLGPSNSSSAIKLSPGDELLNDLIGNKKGKKTLYPTKTTQQPSDIGENLSNLDYGPNKKSPWR